MDLNKALNCKEFDSWFHILVTMKSVAGNPGHTHTYESRNTIQPQQAWVASSSSSMPGNGNHADLNKTVNHEFHTLSHLQTGKSWSYTITACRRSHSGLGGAVAEDKDWK